MPVSPVIIDTKCMHTHTHRESVVVVDNQNARMQNLENEFQK